MTRSLHPNTTRRTLVRSIPIGLGVAPALAVAQAYPSRPVKIVLPYAPGGSADVVTRLLAQKLNQRMGQPFVVENKPGASGNIGLEQVVRSPADGYTLVVVPDSNMTVNAHLYREMKFDPIKDTTPVAMLSTIGIGLVAHPSVPANTVEELIAHARRQADGLSFATPGNGTPHHLAGELLKESTGANLVHIPYKGGAPALQDGLGGQVPLGFVALAIAAPHVRSGKLRLLAVTQGTRSSVFASTPTVGETVRGFDVTSWLGLFAPAGTPAEIVRRLNTEVNQALGEPSSKETLSAQALDVIAGSPEDLAQRVRIESERWGALIKARNIRIG